MRIRAASLGLAASVLSLSYFSARAADSYVAGWKITVEDDPFSTKKKTIAMALSGEAGILAFRCFPDEGLSVLVIPLDDKREYKAGQSIHFKYRADKEDVVEDDAQVFGEHAVEMPNARQILNDAGRAGTLFLRVQTPSETAVDLAFKMKGASKALAGIKSDCATDAKDEKPEAKKPDK